MWPVLGEDRQTRLNLSLYVVDGPPRIGPIPWGTLLWQKESVRRLVLSKNMQDRMFMSSSISPLCTISCLGGHLLGCSNLLLPCNQQNLTPSQSIIWNQSSLLFCDSKSTVHLFSRHFHCRPSSNLFIPPPIKGISGISDLSRTYDFRYRLLLEFLELQLGGNCLFNTTAPTLTPTRKMWLSYHYSIL